MLLIKDILSILSGCLTPTIAVITTYIAIMEHKNSINKTKLDLYEKRYKVYSALTKFISINLKDDVLSQDDLNQYRADTNESVFLFDKNVSGYIGQVFEKAIQKNINIIKSKDERLAIEDRKHFSNKKHESINWFDAQFEIVGKMFMKYLCIKG